MERKSQHTVAVRWATRAEAFQRTHEAVFRLTERNGIEIYDSFEE